MYCKKCGTRIKEGTRYCPKCGADQNPTPQIETQINDITQQTHSTNTTTHAIGDNKAGVFLVLIVAAVLALYSFYGKGNHGKDIPSDEPEKPATEETVSIDGYWYSAGVSKGSSSRIDLFILVNGEDVTYGLVEIDTSAAEIIAANSAAIDSGKLAYDQSSDRIIVETGQGDVEFSRATSEEKQFVDIVLELVEKSGGSYTAQDEPRQDAGYWYYEKADYNNNEATAAFVVIEPGAVILYGSKTVNMTTGETTDAYLAELRDETTVRYDESDDKLLVRLQNSDRLVFSRATEQQREFIDNFLATAASS